MCVCVCVTLGSEGAFWPFTFTARGMQSLRKHVPTKLCVMMEAGLDHSGVPAEMIFDSLLPSGPFASVLHSADTCSSIVPRRCMFWKC